jgi:hypothetical protein
MKLVKKFESYVKKGNAGADSKKFKFKFEKTGCKRGYRVTWCPDAYSLHCTYQKLILNTNENDVERAQGSTSTAVQLHTKRQ